MPAAGEREAERLPELVSAVRHSIDTLRDRWLGLRIGGEDATMRGQWAALVLSALVVFACFFAIGRSMRARGSAGAGAPATLEGSATQAAVPDRLSGGSPIAGAVPVAIVAKPRARTPQPAARALPAVVPSVVVTSAPTTTVVASEPTLAPARPSAPAPSSSPAPSSAPRVKPTPSGSRSTGGTGVAPAPAAPGGGVGNAGGTGAAPAPGARAPAGPAPPSPGEPPAGGSFDSSE